TLLRGEVGEHVTCAGDADGVAPHECVVSEVAQQHALADAVGPHEDGVDALVEKSEAKELLDGRSVDLTWPGPVEVCNRLEGAYTCLAQSACEASTLALGLLDVEQLVEPRLAGDIIGAGE